MFGDKSSISNPYYPMSQDDLKYQDSGIIGNIAASNAIWVETYGTRRKKGNRKKSDSLRHVAPIDYNEGSNEENEEEIFLGRSVTQTQSVSEEVAQKIDKEIRKLVDEGYNQATKILTEKIDDLHKIAKALITYETLSGEEIENIINKNLYPKDKVVEKPEENDDQSSALGAMGLKPKIVH